MTSELKIDLTSFGYADGGYMSKCSHCKETFLGAKRSWSCEPCAIKKTLEPKIIRTTPNVPELVRYSFGHRGEPYETKTGEYVRHDQAVAVIAVKDEEIKRLRLNSKGTFRRALAAEAKLSQIEKQEPVTHYIVSDFGGEFDKVKMMPIGRHPLYAAPVASDADLRAETIRKCANEIKGLRRLLNAQTVALDISREDAIYKICEDAIRALNPSEPRT